MKITVEEMADIPENEIIVRCKERDLSVDKLISALKFLDQTISVKKDGKNYILPVSDIYYFDCADNKVFCYTQGEVYETNFKLYEIESLPDNTKLVRVSKRMIVDAGKIKAFKAQLNGRMEAILINDEKIEINRNYVPALKIKLGGLAK